MPTPDAHGGRHPLLAAQEGIWTGQQLDLGSPAYNTAEYVSIHGPVDPAAFEEALRHTVGEVEALNVRFVVDGQGRPWQRCVRSIDWQPYIADLTTDADPHRAALDWMAQDMTRPVDLERDPVFGHALLRTAPDQFLWYHRVHHIALDGFGLSLVAQRVAQVYTALVEGGPARRQRLRNPGVGTAGRARVPRLETLHGGPCVLDTAVRGPPGGGQPRRRAGTPRAGLPASYDRPRSG